MIGAATALVYDTGALVKAEAGHQVVWGFHRRIQLKGIRPVIPALVLAQAWRGGPQHQLGRLLKGCEIDESLTEAEARAIGKLLAVTETRDVVDAAVVLTAARRAAAILTSDPDDLTKLAGTLAIHIPILRV